MNIDDQRKVIIVEGTTDKRKIQSIIKEPVDIICTNGTVGTTKLDELAEMLDFREIYVLVDADEAGEKLRRLLKREFPQAEHLYIDRSYREVATAPSQHLASVLLGADISVFTDYLRTI